MRGLTHMAQDRNFMHDLFNIDRSDRDPEPVKAAFADFKRLLERYPNSLYANDAQQRMIALKNRLAEYDLATADFIYAVRLGSPRLIELKSYRKPIRVLKQHANPYLFS